MELIKRDNDHDNSLQPWVVGVVAGMTGLSLLAVCLRLWSRHIKQQKLWWDDWMIMFSMGWNLVVVGFIFAMYSSGMGIHATEVPLPEIVMMAKWLLVAEILYAWNLCFTKMAVLLMYYRIFRFPFFQRMAYLVGGFVLTWGVVITFLFIFICVPVQKLWYPQLPGRCVNQVGTWIANAASTILTDLIILLLPVRELWRLQMRKHEKIGLTLIFSLGFFVVFASAYRFRVLFTYSNKDPTYTLAPTVGWTVIEMSAGIVSACLPILRPVLGLCFSKLGLPHLRSRSQLSSGRQRSADPHLSKTSNVNEMELEGSTSSEPRDGGDAWFNDHDSEKLVQPHIGRLRPDHGCEFTATSARTGSPHALTADEPLRSPRGITVKTEFSHTSHTVV